MEKCNISDDHMRTRNKIVFGLMGLIIAISIINAISVKAATTNTFQITTAYSCDLDNDVKEDDIYAKAVLTLEGVEKTTTALIYELLKPSGEEVVDYYIYTTTADVITFEFFFINHVTVGGDYTFSVHAAVLRGGTGSYYYDSIVFDPPDYSEDEPPDQWSSGSP